ncbi:MAG: hypothetical protein Fur0032_22000 [Terrimicrobiaceae bacterium]
MNELAGALIMLVALDGPLGSGTPEMLARFQSKETPRIAAVFAGGPPTAIEVDWFLDGEGIVAPVARAVLDITPTPNVPLTTVSLPVDLPEVKKPTTFRGVMRAGTGDGEFHPAGDFRLMLFPADHFDSQWKRVAKSGLPISLSGLLTGLRELLSEREVRFGEGESQRPDSIDGNGVLVIQVGDSNPASLFPGQARAMLVYSGASEGLRLFGEAKDGDKLLWVSGAPRVPFAQDPIAQQMLLQLIEPLIHETTP